MFGQLCTFFILICSGLIFLHAPIHAQTGSYSLSFPKEPMSLFYPTPPNHIQQVEAFLWKDGDYASLKTMKDLVANWKIPQFVYVTNTNSYYFDSCPQVRTDLPCIMFSAQVTTQGSGKSFLSLEITKLNQVIAWNSTGLEVVAVSTSPVPSPRLTTTPTSTPPPGLIDMPPITPTVYPHAQVEEIKQQVLYLEEKLSEQNKQIQSQQSIINKIVAFLTRILKF